MILSFFAHLPKQRTGRLVRLRLQRLSTRDSILPPLRRRGRRRKFWGGVKSRQAPFRLYMYCCMYYYCGPCLSNKHKKKKNTERDDYHRVFCCLLLKNTYIKYPHERRQERQRELWYRTVGWQERQLLLAGWRYTDSDYNSRFWQ